MAYQFDLLDPRPASREGELARLAQMGATLGAEVTVPEFAALLTEGNIDPQHSGSDIGTAAIEAAVAWPLPSSGTTIVTVRPDADSFGVMAVLSLRGEGVMIDGEIAERVAEIGLADRTHTEWDPAGDPVDVSPLSALKARVADFRIPLEERVEAVREFLLTGEFAGWKDVANRVEQERRETVGLLDDVALAESGRVAVITTASRFGTAAAYAHADVVVAVNPGFRFQGGDPHRKVTVAQRKLGNIDLKGVFAALSEVEPGWGGSPTVGGSPQGVSSVIPTDEIVRVVEEHLLD